MLERRTCLCRVDSVSVAGEPPARHQLVRDVSGRMPSLGSRVAHLRQRTTDKLIERREDIREHGDDLAGVRASRRPS
jgi:phosphoketolase